MSDVILSLSDYASANGRTERTVLRWLNEGRLPDAVKRDGRWEIPADAQPVAASAGQRVVAASADTSNVMSHVMTFASALEVLPALVDVDTAAQLLGISPYAVTQHAEELDGRRWGRNGGWVIPVGTIRRLAGLS